MIQTQQRLLDGALRVRAEAIEIVAAVQPDGLVAHGPDGARGLVTGVPHANLNGVLTIVSRPAVEDVARLVAMVDDRVGGSLPWSIQVGGEPSPAIRRIAADHGLTVAEPGPVLVRTVDREPCPVSLPAGVTVGQVPAERADRFLGGLSECWEASRTDMWRMATPELLRVPGMSAWVTEEGGQVTSTAFVGVVGEWAFVANVATRADCRRRGLGRAVMSAAVLGAGRSGARHVALMSSEAGLPLYRAMGFTHVGSTTTLVAG